MSSKDYDMVNYLVRALESIELERKSVEGRVAQKINLSSTSELIQKAKELAKPSDLILIKEFEEQVKKLTSSQATKENLKALEQLSHQFGAEVYMSKALLGFTKEQYNTFLGLIEKDDLKKYLLGLSEGIEFYLSEKDIASLLELEFVKKENSKVTLTERGFSLTRALKLTELQRKNYR